MDHIPKVSELTLASRDKRLINGVVDSMVFLVVIVILIFLLYIVGLVGILFGRFSLAFLILGYAFYYWILEISFNGKTFGKVVTKTKVLMHTGEKPDYVNYFLRSICRLIPFEFVSFLIGDSVGWHDKFSKTIVVDDSGTAF